MRLLDLRAIETMLGRGRPGSTRLRQAVRSHLHQLAATRSELEREFLLLCDEADVPVPEVNVKVERVLVDAVWRNKRVIVELDGGPGHGTPARNARDRRNELRLRAAGYAVIRYTWDQVTRQPELVVAGLRAGLNWTAPSAARGSR